MMLLVTVLACITGLHATTTTMCPDLVPGTNMTVSNVEGYVGDPAVIARCSTGHVFDTGHLTKYIACVNSTTGTEWAAVWNDTLGTCSKKSCANITNELGSNTTASNVDVNSIYGDTATVTCSPGYAFSVNMSAPVTSRVTSSVNITCEDDPSSASAVWSHFGTCSEVACETPYEVNDATVTYTTTTLGSRVVYQCVSGYWFVPGVYTVIASCNSSAGWETDNGPGWILGENVHCTKMDAFVGCLDTGGMVVSENASGSLGTSECRSYCKAANFRYASLDDELCSCGDFLEDNFSERESIQCNASCVDHEINSTSVPAYCGGVGNLITVYSSLAGCYKYLSVPATIQGETITEDYQTTCSERCRGNDDVIAAVQGTQCYCFNTTNLDGMEVDKQMCNRDLNSTSTEYTMVYDLGKTSVTAETCEELFELGVRMHGYYYLEEPYRRELCHFKDGTDCGSEWVGFEGHCYLFGADAVMNFTEARDFCISNNADLSSITTQEEYNFMKQTRTLFNDVWVDKTQYTSWWIGLYDSNGTNLYSWIDGNMMRVYKFSVGQPSGDKDLQCVMEKGYKWQTTDCDSMANVICKRPQGWNECKSLATTPVAQYSFTDNHMTLTFCIEKCKGKNTTYAIVHDHTCWCADIVPSHTNLNKSDCSESCPGDPIQMCAGEADTYLVLKVTDRVTAKSCEDLQILGIGNDTFLTSPDTTPILEYCIVPECPYSWVSIGRHCYKFYPIADHEQAFTTCAENDAYLVTIEDVEEMNLLVSTANNISIYSGQDAWRIGLQALSKHGTEMRWSNGFVFDPDLWNDTFISMDGPEVLLTNLSQWMAQEFSEQAFICESGKDYIGCYNTTGILNDTAYEYTKMTIQQCIELCRAKSRPFAFISVDVCFCEDELTNEEPGQCTSSCSGQFNQICGGDGISSVYNVSEYTQFAETCDDLFDAGIFITENYIVNGTLQTCIFKDGTNCSYGWFGYGGHCYQHFPVSESESRADVCTNKNATLTSLMNVGELDVLEDYLSKIQFDLDDNYAVYTGITNGLYEFNVTISQDGLLVDPDLVSNNNVNISDLYDYGHLTLHNNGDTSKDGGVLCKHKKYTIGCFNPPDSSIQPAIADFESMELTLCKQTCIGKMAEIALMGLTDCYCCNISDLSTLSVNGSEACNHPCKLVIDQTCGNGFVVWAHFTAENEVPIADNCSGLYQGGVFLNQTYKLDNPQRYKTCGFTDTTSCPAGWLGNNNTCIKILPSASSNFMSTKKTCSKAGGYLFNPTGHGIAAFLESIFTTSDMFRFHTHWQTGVYPVFYNMSYVTSRGEMVVDANFDPDSPPGDGAVYYDSNNTMLYKRTSKIPFICETDDNYTSCVDIHQTADAEYDTDGNSITMCMYWCKGQGHNYSAVSHTTCQCFHTDISSFTLQPESCTTSCPGVHSQVCGDTDHDYFTYIRTNNVSVVPKTCSDLYLHGVFRSGQYMLEHNSQDISVQCFTAGLLSLMSLDSVKSVKASSSKSGHNESTAKLAYPYNTGWKPNENEAGTWINIKFSEWYLVAGVIMAGIHTKSEQSYIQTYAVKYRNLLTGTMDVIPYTSTEDVWPGCTNSYTKCSTYPADPVVTTEITLYPLTWQSAISLQASIYGQQFANFNHGDSYLGCYLDGNNLFSIEGTDMSLENCLDLCRGLAKQFAGIDGNNNCLCGEMSEDFGYTDESFCPYNNTASKRLGTDSHNIRAIYRTYADDYKKALKKCEKPFSSAVVICE